jgi:hypothetical protein
MGMGMGHMERWAWASSLRLGYRLIGLSNIAYQWAVYAPALKSRRSGWAVGDIASSSNYHGSIELPAHQPALSAPEVRAVV